MGEGVVVATLQDLGWEAMSPHVWVDPKGEKQVEYLREPMGFAQMKKHIKEAVEDKCWKEATNWHLGDGLEMRKPDYHDAGREITRMERQGR